MADWIIRQALAARGAVHAVLDYMREGEEGQGLVEYALILVLIAVLIIVSVRFLQPAINVQLNNVANSF